MVVITMLSLSLDAPWVPRFMSIYLSYYRIPDLQISCLEGVSKALFPTPLCDMLQNIVLKWSMAQKIVLKWSKVLGTSGYQSYDVHTRRTSKKELEDKAFLTTRQCTKLTPGSARSFTFLPSAILVAGSYA